MKSHIHSVSYDAPTRVNFCGVTLVDEDIKVIVELVAALSLQRPSFLVTPNADHFCRLHESTDVEFGIAYARADLRVCDSRIIQKLSMIGGEPLSQVVPGSDLTRALLEADWVKSSRLLVVGSTRSEIDAIRKAYSLQDISVYEPPMGFIRDSVEVDLCIQAIASSGARLVFLAVGSPQQEKLALRVTQRLEAGRSEHPFVMICIGASFDFLSGRARRAPRMLQSLHLEWLHRALGDPLRLIPRYYRNFIWIARFVAGARGRPQ